MARNDLTTEELARLEELRREAGELQDALRPLLGIAALGELDYVEEQRKGRIEARLAEIRGAAATIDLHRRQRARERVEAAREDEARRLREAGERRTRHDGEMSLRLRIIRARRERMTDLGAGGINTGGQPKGHRLVAEFANKVERELAAEFDEQALELVGVEARYVRELTDDHAWGIKIKPGGSGEIVVGTPPPPDPTVVSPTPSPHQDSGKGPLPSVPYLPS